MRVLFDTHILLWALIGDEKLPSKAREFIASDNDFVCYSSISIWEVAIKYMKNPDKINNISPEALRVFCDSSKFQEISLSANHVMMLQTLSRPDDAPPHNDPFDRILLAQAKAEDMTFLTHDSLLTYYNEDCIVCA